MAKYQQNRGRMKENAPRRIHLGYHQNCEGDSPERSCSVMSFVFVGSGLVSKEKSLCIFTLDNPLGESTLAADDDTPFLRLTFPRATPPNARADGGKHMLTAANSVATVPAEAMRLEAL